jgi:hypothetical protein
VHHPCEQAFAGTRRAGNHQAAVCWCNPINGLAQGLNNLTAANQICVFARLLSQNRVLGLQRRSLQRALDQDQQAVGVEWLFNKIVSALLDRPDRCFDRTVAGHHHNRRVRDVLRVFFEQTDAVSGRPLQPDVLKNQIRSRKTNLSARLGITMSCANTVPFVLQNATEQHPDIGFVINNENVSGH